MKRILNLYMVLMLTSAIYAQGRMPQMRFDPQRFQADLEQFITREAGLTPMEAAAFFPVYREMLNKQRALYMRAGRNGFVRPTDDASCRKAILQRDELELQIKEIQKKYHERFLKILPAKKVFDAINAEDRFHRQSFQRVAGRRGPKK